MRSSLTLHFGTYAIAKYEKNTGQSVMDLLDIGNFEINRIVNLIKLGNASNKNIQDEEDYYKILDEYLKEEDHSLISAYFDLLDDLDKDIKILKSCGVKVEDLKSEFSNMAENNGANFKERLSNTKDELNTENNVEDSENKE